MASFANSFTTASFQHNELRHLTGRQHRPSGQDDDVYTGSTPFRQRAGRQPRQVPSETLSIDMSRWGASWVNRFSAFRLLSVPGIRHHRAEVAASAGITGRAISRRLRGKNLLRVYYGDWQQRDARAQTLVRLLSSRSTITFHSLSRRRNFITYFVDLSHDFSRSLWHKYFKAERWWWDYNCMLLSSSFFVLAQERDIIRNVLCILFMKVRARRKWRWNRQTVTALYFIAVDIRKRSEGLSPEHTASIPGGF